MCSKEFEKFLQEAKIYAEKKEFYKFARNITLAEKLARTKDEKRGLYKTEIEGLIKNNSYPEALEATDKTEEVLGKADFKFYVLIKRGITVAHMEEYKRAISLLNRVTECDLPEKKVEAHINLVWVYLVKYDEKNEMEYLEKAEENCNKALELLESCEVSKRLYNIFLNNLGCVYHNKEDYDKALEVFQERKENLVDESNYPIVHNNIAAMLVEKNRTDDAEGFLHKALRKAERQKNYNEIAENYLVRADIAMLDQDYNRVRDYYIVAYDNFAKAKNLQKACSVFKDIQAIDFKVNNESLDILSRQLKNA